MPFIQLQFRRDLSSNWTSNNPTLAPGELGIETDTNLFKIGTGVDWVGTSYGGLQGLPGATGDSGGLTGFSGPTGTVLFYDGSAVTGTNLKYEETYQGNPAVYLSGGIDGNGIIFDYNGNGYMTIGDVGTGGNVGTIVEVLGRNNLILRSENVLDIAGPTFKLGINYSYGTSGQYLASDGMDGVTWKDIPSVSGSLGQTGRSFSTAIGPPSAMGASGDSYLNASNGDLYVFNSSSTVASNPIGQQINVVSYQSASDSVGNIYITTSQGGSEDIYKIDTNNVVTVFSQAMTIPLGIAIDSLDNIYVASQSQGIIYKLDSQGTPTFFADTNSAGYLTCIICDSSDNIYACEEGLGNIFKITPQGAVTTYATFVGPNPGFFGIAIDSVENLYVTGSRDHTIYKIDTSGTITIYAGNGNLGFVNGASANAEFNFPYGICIDSSDNVYITDIQNFVIRKIDTSGLVSTYAGDGTSGYLDGLNANAKFGNVIYSLTIDSLGDLYTVDIRNIRKITSTNVTTITTQTINSEWSLIGNLKGGTGFSGITGTVLFYDGSAVTGTNLTYSDLYSGNPAVYLSEPTYGNGIIFDYNNGSMAIGDIGSGAPGNMVQVYGQNELQLNSSNTLSLSGLTFKCQINNSYGISGQYLASDGMDGVTWKEIPSVSGSSGTEFSGATGTVLFYDGSSITGTNLTYSDFYDGDTGPYLSENTFGNGIVFNDNGTGHMRIGNIGNTGGNTGNIVTVSGGGGEARLSSSTLRLSGSTFICSINGDSGVLGQYLASDGMDGVTWKYPMFASGGYGNVLIVDQVYGNDSTASIGGLPYQTVEAAIQGISGTTGTTVWVMPGTYNVAGTIHVPNETALRGLNTQTCIIQNLEPADNEILLGMGENCRVEDLTFKLTSAEHHALTGIRFQQTSTQTSKLRNLVVTVDNSAASSGGSSNVYGINCNGTGTFTESTFPFDCIKGSTINVKSNGAGRKRGIYVSLDNQVSIRDTNIYVATPPDTSSTGTYVGVETNDSNELGSIQIRSSSIGAPKQLNPPTFTSSDILQTQPSVITNPAYLASPGIQIGPGVDLLTKSAGGRPFSTYSYPTTLYYGLRGLIKDGAAAGVTGYLWPGTQAVSASFPDITTPAAYYRVQQPVILSGINIHSNTSTSANGGATFFVFKTSGAGMTLLSDFTAGFTASQTDFSYYNSSHDFASGDLIHVGVVQTGGGNNNTMGDITIQLDMF